MGLDRELQRRVAAQQRGEPAELRHGRGQQARREDREGDGGLEARDGLREREVLEVRDARPAEPAQLHEPAWRRKTMPSHGSDRRANLSELVLVVTSRTKEGLPARSRLYRSGLEQVNTYLLACARCTRFADFARSNTNFAALCMTQEFPEFC